MATEELKNRILDEATAMFLREGYNKTNLDTLSQMIFVSKRTIYKLFENKKGLYRECIKRIISTMEEDDNLTMSQKYNPVNSISNFIKSHSREELMSKEQALNDLNKYFPDIYDECLKSSEERRMKKIISQITMGQENGDIDPTINPEMVALIIQKLLKQRAMPEPYPTNDIESKYLKSEIFSHFIHIFLRGLLTKKRIKEYDENIT
ncbi:MAG: TetR/AcrR family transcriptional regulator [Bacteroidales bacterium]|nr:TetR/AcrR family transcriptional regulator [Bacteroidales bacterium]